MDIHWYPGHMTKTKRMLQTQLALVDVVVELLDARVPLSSKNPDVDLLARGKHRIFVLNKADLADPAITKEWEDYYAARHFDVLSMCARDTKSAARVVEAAKAAISEKAARQRQRGRIVMTVRAMVVGIPNAGKSTFINQLAGTAAAAASDRPGVTRGRQWIKIRPDFDMLDTPGILWPKFSNESTGIKLAATGAIKDDIVDKVTLCESLLAILSALKPDAMKTRYRLQSLPETPRALLTEIGAARGFKTKGAMIDLERTAMMVLDEFRAGTLGRVSLERPDTSQA